MTNTTAKTLILSALPLFLLPLNAQAQIAADGTTSTTVTPTTTGVQIDNGDRSGGNLFHSFQNFSVPTGTEAYFNNNADDIANIFSRVTGGNISDIDGLIRANGTANLFLINPNGIVFGENASLNIGGSFFATTADSISFDGDVAFSASDPTTPLLTSTIPIGANFRDNPGDITNQAGNISQQSPGLTISSGKIITLLGGNVTFDGGQIVAPNGINVEIGGLTAEGTVTIEEDGSLSFPQRVNRGDITFSNQSIVASVPIDNTDRAIGSININGKNINVKNISLLVAGSTGIAEESDVSEAGDITLNAQGGSIELSNSGIISESDSNSTDNFAEIELAAPQGSISIVDNSVISAANSSDRGFAGDIILNANNEINILNSALGSRNDLFSNLIPNSDARGNGNNSRIFIGSHPNEEVALPSKVIIQGTRSPEPEPENPENDDPRSDSVFTTNLSSTNFDRDDGQAGRIDISATEEINIFGSRLDSNTEIRNLTRPNSSIEDNFSTVSLKVLEDNPEGKIILNQAEINNTNSNIGYAGDIILNAPNSIEITRSQLLADGRNGRILIGKSETSGETFSPQNVTIKDFSRLTTTNSYVPNTDEEGNPIIATIDAGDIFISANQDILLDNDSRLKATNERPGNAGSIFLNSQNLTIIGQSPEEPEIEVTSNILDGNAGNIDITTNNLFQDGGEISADTKTEGANINLSIDNDWRLENESLVSAEVDARENPEPKKASGGNIDINTNNKNSELLIFAFPSSPRGNDITASARGGANGGKIDINNPAGVFGIRERERIENALGESLLRQNALNDFDVSSDSGVEGIIEIDTFDDPSSSLVELPASVGDASDTISQNPCEQGVGSEFLVTGKGGFPANPQNNFSSDQVRIGLVEPVPTQNQTATIEQKNTTLTEEGGIVPAQGWVSNNEGKVLLTAYDPTQEGVQRKQDPLTGCPVP